MPYGDKTGPEGMGPMTGRGAGDCSDTTQPGRGLRRFFGNMFGAANRRRGKGNGNAGGNNRRTGGGRGRAR